MMNLSDHIKKRMKDNFLMKRNMPIQRDMKTLNTSSLMMNFGSFYIPKMGKSNPMGEDAHFTSKDHQTIGLADGISSWAKKGIDAGEYARQLMNNCLVVLDAKDREIVYPQLILEEAYLNTKVDGSSTACIITLTGESLNVVNVGDSGFMLFRNAIMIYKSSTQQHGFNYPYQLGKSNHCDDPRVAEEFMIGVRAGDWVVAGTNGLFDNMYASEMEVAMKVIGEAGCLEPQVLAQVLADLAFENSLDYTQGISPYSQAALKEGYPIPIKCGGKPDDITVIVAHIVPTQGHTLVLGNIENSYSFQPYLPKKSPTVNVMDPIATKRCKPIKKGMKTLNERSLMMNIGSSYIPKKGKSNPKGEDAHFISKHHQTFGLADGVSSWAKKGIDAGEYARQLMDNCLTILYKKDMEIVYPQLVLQEAYSNTEVNGSSTACIITLTDESLNVVNVGDSGFMLFRKGNMIYKSSTQQHRFNSPYQLGKNSHCDDPSVAEEFIIGVRGGDLVVAGTDGLFDNVFASEMEVIIKQIIGTDQPELLAQILAEQALENSLKTEGVSPYSQAASMEGYRRRSGGKPDDITVVVAHILPPNHLL